MIMQSSKLRNKAWRFVIQMTVPYIKGNFSSVLHRETGITENAARHVLQRIRVVFSDEEAMLTSNVAIDDIYIRGKEWNKRESKNFKAGHRTAGKTAAVGAKEDCCIVAAKPVPTADTAAFGGVLGGK